MVLSVFEHILGLRKACISYCGLACEVSPFLNASQAQLGAYSSYMFAPSSVWHCLMYSRGFVPCVFCCITRSVHAPTLLRILHMCRSCLLALLIFSDLLRHTHARHCQFRFLWNYQIGSSIGFFFGPTANVMVSQLRNPETGEINPSIVPYSLITEDLDKNTNLRAWVGVNAGFRF